jgi:hypothetical protein
LRRDRIPFRVTEQHFRKWEHARLFIIQEQLNRHLSEVAISYLRGLRCHEAIRKHGGDRKSQAWVGGLRPSVSALAEIFRVSEATIRRDVELVVAVYTIMASWEPQGKEAVSEAKGLLLARETGLKRQTILAMAELDVARQRALLMDLKRDRKLPRGWRNAGEPATISLPRGLEARAKVIVKREGSEAAGMLASLLAAAVPQAAEPGGTLVVPVEVANVLKVNLSTEFPCQRSVGRLGWAGLVFAHSPRRQQTAKPRRRTVAQGQGWCRWPRVIGVLPRADAKR